MTIDKRTLAVVEIAVLVAGYLFITWYLGPRIEAPWAGTTAILLIVGGIGWVSYISPVRIHGDDNAERGFGNRRTLYLRTDNLAAAIKEFGLLALVAAFFLLLVATRTNPGFLERQSAASLAIKLGYYFCFALVQGTFFFGFILVRLGKLFPPPNAGGGPGGRSPWSLLLAVAAIFTICHLPNPNLMAVAFPAAVAFGRRFARTPNTVVLAATHAVLGTLLHKAVGLHMRVGPFYWDRDSYLIGHLLPFLNGWKQIIYNP